MKINLASNLMSRFIDDNRHLFRTLHDERNDFTGRMMRLGLRQAS